MKKRSGWSPRYYGKAIEEMENESWHLHTYATSGLGSYRNVNHYLAPFERR